MAICMMHGDSFTSHHTITSKLFSTKDRDNDEDTGDCSNAHKAGWWYGFQLERPLPPRPSRFIEWCT